MCRRPGPRVSYGFAWEDCTNTTPSLSFPGNSSPMLFDRVQRQHYNNTLKRNRSLKSLRILLCAAGETLKCCKRWGMPRCSDSGPVARSDSHMGRGSAASPCTQRRCEHVVKADLRRPAATGLLAGLRNLQAGLWLASPRPPWRNTDTSHSQSTSGYHEPPQVWNQLDLLLAPACGAMVKARFFSARAGFQASCARRLASRGAKDCASVSGSSGGAFIGTFLAKD